MSSIHLSVTVTGRPSKGAVLDSLQRQLKRPGHAKSVSNEIAQDDDRMSPSTAVILASPEFASWSEDQGFMSQLLATLHQGRRQGDMSDTSAADASHMDVLFGVIDGVADPYRLHSKPRQGLSIIYGGTTSLLPSLWEQGKIAGKGEPERASSVQLKWPPLYVVRQPLVGEFRRRRPADGAEAVGGEVTPGGRLRAGTARTAGPHPLMPLAPPRKIVAGLGNIVRQVEIDGVVTPASKELETLIPRLFEKRAARAGGTGQAPSPIGVWAWVMPAWTIEKMRYDAVFTTYQDTPHAEEWQLTSTHATITKRLSGGGGWGAKQGLLSLDPETTYAAPEQDDIDVFIKAFEERNSADQSSSSEGIVSPGSYIMFCVEPERGAPSSVVDPSSGLVGSRLTLAVAPKDEELLQQGIEGGAVAKMGKTTETEVDVVPGHFGAASSTGLYLKSPFPQHPWSTKIDAPYSAVSWDWTPPDRLDD
ncbi:hypothetical protein PG994_012090 [Apiospora phragmitis]|uniref:Uncharacterized protein n=1 Tax=Apiospora phragmitis TaxID=2905665 RepID=A0ABR1TWV7_9PEZI